MTPADLRFADLSPEQQADFRRRYPGLDPQITPGPNSPLLAGVGGRAKPRPLEEAEQERVIVWRDQVVNAGIWPEMRWMFHPANGGKRDRKTAAKMKKAGVVAGVLDLWLPVRRLGYVGCVVEVKEPNGAGPTEEQLKWVYHLAAEGWFVSVEYGAPAVINRFETFLKMEKWTG